MAPPYAPHNDFNLPPIGKGSHYSFQIDSVCPKIAAKMSAGQYEQCLEWLDEALIHHPSNIRLLEYKFLCFYERKMYERAFCVARHLVDLFPGLAFGYTKMGDVYVKVKMLAKANEYYLKAIKVDPRCQTTLQKYREFQEKYRGQFQIPTQFNHMDDRVPNPSSKVGGRLFQSVRVGPGVTGSRVTGRGPPKLVQQGSSQANTNGQQTGTGTPVQYYRVPSRPFNASFPPFKTQSSVLQGSARRVLGRPVTSTPIQAQSQLVVFPPPSLQTPPPPLSLQTPPPPLSLHTPPPPLYAPSPLPATSTGRMRLYHPRPPPHTLTDLTPMDQQEQTSLLSSAVPMKIKNQPIQPKDYVLTPQAEQLMARRRLNLNSETKKCQPVVENKPSTPPQSLTDKEFDFGSLSEVWGSCDGTASPFQKDQESSKTLFASDAWWFEQCHWNSTAALFRQPRFFEMAMSPFPQNREESAFKFAAPPSASESHQQDSVYESGSTSSGAEQQNSLFEFGATSKKEDSALAATSLASDKDVNLLFDFVMPSNVEITPSGDCKFGVIGQKLGDQETKSEAIAARQQVATETPPDQKVETKLSYSGAVAKNCKPATFPLPQPQTPQPTPKTSPKTSLRAAAAAAVTKRVRRSLAPISDTNLEDPATNPQNPKECKTVWVGNITTEIKTHMLAAQFDKIGGVESIFMQYPTYCAFVNFVAPRYAGHAMAELQGMVVHGCVLKLRYSDKELGLKQDKPAGRGGEEMPQQPPPGPGSTPLQLLEQKRPSAQQAVGGGVGVSTPGAAALPPPVAETAAPKQLLGKRERSGKRTHFRQFSRGTPRRGRSSGTPPAGPSSSTSPPAGTSATNSPPVVPSKSYYYPRRLSSLPRDY